MGTEAENDRGWYLLLAGFHLGLRLDGDRLVLDFDGDLGPLNEPPVGSSVHIRTERVPASIPYLIASRICANGRTLLILQPDPRHSFATRWHAALSARDLVWGQITVDAWDPKLVYDTRVAYDIVLPPLGDEPTQEKSTRPQLHLVKNTA